MQSTTHCRKPSICDNCSSLNVDDLFATFSPAVTFRQVTDLGTLNLTNSAQSCDGCQFFRAVKVDSVSPFLSDSYTLCSRRAPFKFLADPDRENVQVLCVVKFPAPDHAPGFRDRDLQATIEHQGFIASTTPQELQLPQTSPRARLVQPDRVNIHIIREWIDLCHQQHGNTCSAYISSSEKPINLRLIDCETRKIVDARSDVSYAALSYVWGSSHDSSVANVRKTSLPTMLPRTIDDAIILVRQLGIGFIWIDRYCIDQTDVLGLPQQIKQMDLVYRNAEITIVDAAGEDPSFGLPGVTTTQRIPQPNAIFGKHHLVSLMTDPKEDIKASRWMQRAWTYQESFFSCRRLFFTRSQVYWECRNNMARESVHYSNGASYDRLIDSIDISDERPWTIVHSLKAYTGRQLTYSTDILRAFEGVFHYFQGIKSSFNHYLGLPIMPSEVFVPLVLDQAHEPLIRSQSESFLAALCWANTEIGERRSEFPSWTWAGWTSQVSDRWPECQYGLQLDAETKLELFIETKDGTLLDFNDYQLSTLPTSPYESLSTIIHIEAWCIPLRLQYLPDDAEAWIGYFRESFRPWTKNLSGYFAVFEAESQRVELAVYSNTFVYATGTTGKSFSKHPHSNETIGVVLGRCDGLENLNFGQRVFLLIVQHNGQHFERVGHACLDYDMLRISMKEQHNPWDVSRKKAAWELCFRSKTRRKVRLG